MVNFKPVDYKDILYPVHTLKRGVSIFDSFPKLLDYQEFVVPLPGSISIDKVFKYIVFVYDAKSPFFNQIEDLVDRKKQAIVEAGFKPDNSGNFRDSVKDILNCEDNKVNKMIIRYCRMQGKDFTNLIASQEAYYQINLELIKGISKEENALDVAKSKAQLDKLADEFNVRLNEKARAFLSQETAQGLHDDLWSLAEDESVNINLSPEDYAE